MFRNKALPPSHGVGIWIEAFGFVHPPSQHIGPPFEQRLVRVGAAHPEAEPAVSGEQVADRLEDIDTRRRLGFAIGLCLFDQRTDLGCDRLEAAADPRCEAILIKAATPGAIGLRSETSRAGKECVRTGKYGWST